LDSGQFSHIWEETKVITQTRHQEFIINQIILNQIKRN